MENSNAPTPADYVGFYSADIGTTVVIAGVTGSLTEHSAKLTPGRYLVAARTFSDAAALAWIHVGTGASAITPAPGTPVAGGTSRIPLSANGWVEYVVVKDRNDRIGVQMSTGTGSIYVSKISRGPDA